MKRLRNIYENIYNMDNLCLADQKARKHKSNQPGVILFDKNKELNLRSIQERIQNKRYSTSVYTTFKIYEPKEREIFRLPYCPDRIIHHAIMNPLRHMFISCFTADTYSCIPGRGIHGASYKLRSALKNVDGTTYCLKLDIKKFHPSISHDVLKRLLRKKIKDKDLLWLLDEIIDSAPGLPIGNYLSQYLANFYLTYFDHWLKETKRVKHYFRYADDIVILSNSKTELHQLLADIRKYLGIELQLEIKNNYQVFLVESRGIDFVGYVHFHKYTRLRKGIKMNLVRAVAKNKVRSFGAYNGWLKHGDCIRLKQKLKLAA